MIRVGTSTVCTLQTDRRWNQAQEQACKQTNIRKLSLIKVLLLSCQVVQVRWSSAPTATTTPTSIHALGSTARTPIWGRTTHWIRVYRAWRRASVSMHSTRTQLWRASLATRTPPSFSPRTIKGSAATLPRSTMLMVRQKFQFLPFLSRVVSSSFCLGANYHDLCAEALLGKHAEFSTCSYWKREKNMILKILSSPFAARLLNLADFLASLLLAYYYRRCKHWGHWFNEDCFFLQTERSPMQLANSGLYLLVIDFPDMTYF